MHLRGPDLASIGGWLPIPAVTPVASTAATAGLLALCALASGPIAARVLGPEGRGALAAVQAWPLLLATIGAFGLTEAVAYYAAQSQSRERAVLSTSLVLSVPFLVLAGLAGIWIVPWALGDGMRDLHATALACLVLVPLLMLAWAPYQVLRGAAHYRAWNALRLVAPAGWLAVLLGMQWTGSASVATAAFGFVAVTAVSALVTHAYAWRALSGPPAPDRRLAAPMLAYGAPTMLTTMPQWLNVRLDQLVMIAFLDRSALGLYVVAVAWAAAAQPLASVFAHLAVPALAAAPRPGEKARRLFTTGAAASGAAALVLALLTPVLVPLVFGAPFRAAVPAAIVMMLAGGVGAINMIGAECLRGLGRPKSPLAAEWAGLGVTCIALPILIPAAGIVGAAAASLASYTAVFVVQRRLLWRADVGRPDSAALAPAGPALLEMRTP